PHHRHHHPFPTRRSSDLGKLCEFKDIRSSERCGIAIIHQELALVPYLSIAENVFLGNEQAKRGVIGWDRTLTEAQALLDRVGLQDRKSTRLNSSHVKISY